MEIIKNVAQSKEENVKNKLYFDLPFVIKWMWLFWNGEEEA